VIDAFTYSVVATLVELSLVAGVGAVGTPVNAGDAIGAFNNISAVLVEILFVFVVILVVFEFILVSNALSAFVALVISLLILVVFAVMLVVFEVILVSKALSAFVALVVSLVILVVFAVMLVVFEVILVSNALSAFVALVVSAVMLAVFAVTEVGKVAIVAELTPPTLFTVVAKLPLPDPATSPVKVVTAFAAITFVPITKPKFVLASAAVVAPVPPLFNAIVVALQIPDVIVPTVAISVPISFDAGILPFNLSAVMLPANFAFVILKSATPALALCKST
jgi:hypothetical protein